MLTCGGVCFVGYRGVTAKNVKLRNFSGIREPTGTLPEDPVPLGDWNNTSRGTREKGPRHIGEGPLNFPPVALMGGDP